MISTKPIDYNSYTIQIQGKGFQIMPNVGGGVVIFWVVSKEKGISSKFVIARSLTDSLAYADKTEEQIIDDVIRLVKDYIDRSLVKNAAEYTFEYRNGQLLPVENPSWWKKL